MPRSCRGEAKTDDVQQQTEIAQHLKLLANLIFDVPIIRMQRFQLTGEGVGVGGRELFP